MLSLDEDVFLLKEGGRRAGIEIVGEGEYRTLESVAEATMKQPGLCTVDFDHWLERFVVTLLLLVMWFVFAEFVVPFCNFLHFLPPQIYSDHMPIPLSSIIPSISLSQRSIPPLYVAKRMWQKVYTQCCWVIQHSSLCCEHWLCCNSYVGYSVIRKNSTVMNFPFWCSSTSHPLIFSC